MHMRFVNNGIYCFMKLTIKIETRWHGRVILVRSQVVARIPISFLRGERYLR